MRLPRPLAVPALAALFGLAACGAGEPPPADEPAFEEPATAGSLPADTATRTVQPLDEPRSGTP